MAENRDVEHVTFLAQFPAIQCIKYQGDGGARIVLDIPESDVDAVDLLRRWRDVVLMITVVPVKEGSIRGDGRDNALGRTTAKRRVL